MGPGMRAGAFLFVRWALLAAVLICGPADVRAVQAPESDPAVAPEILLIGLGDSLTHGTMDGTNNGINTLHGYLQRVADALAQVATVSFVQPLFDEQGRRQQPCAVPTNLGVDGSDLFSLTGLEYYRRSGVARSYFSLNYLCEQVLPWRLQGLYDKVLYPINLLVGRPVSQLDAAIYLLNRQAQVAPASRASVILWIGNNDSSSAALGYGTMRPTFMPLPLDLLSPELRPGLALLLSQGSQQGLLSFEPYSQASLARNLTLEIDFQAQLQNIFQRLNAEVPELPLIADVYVCTLPYYSSVGYLFDSDDLEYYLRKANAAYAVPSSFQRVAAPGEAISDYTRGDRVSLLTFLCMYVLLAQGHSVDYVNRTLELENTQRDGLVLSEAEQQFIMARIEAFNAAIADEAAAQGGHVHLIDVGSRLNQVLTGAENLVVSGRPINRKWVRGSSFTLDGVHPNYFGHALIANHILEHINYSRGLAAPLYDVQDMLEQDPYVDHDGDGWAPGPDYEARGIPEILFLFTDPDDTDAAAEPSLPSDIWDRISDILLQHFI